MFKSSEDLYLSPCFQIGLSEHTDKKLYWSIMLITISIRAPSSVSIINLVMRLINNLDRELNRCSCEAFYISPTMLTTIPCSKHYLYIEHWKWEHTNQTLFPCISISSMTWCPVLQALSQSPRVPGGQSSKTGKIAKSQS